MHIKKLNSRGFSHLLIALAVVVGVGGFGTYQVVKSSAATQAGVVSVNTQEGCWLAGRVWNDTAKDADQKCSRDCRNKNSSYATKNGSGYCEGHVAFAADQNRCTQVLHRYYIEGLNGCARKANQTDGTDERYCQAGYPYYSADRGDSSTDVCEKNKQAATKNDAKYKDSDKNSDGKQGGKKGTDQVGGSGGKTKPDDKPSGQGNGGQQNPKPGKTDPVKVPDIRLRNLRDAAASSNDKILKPNTLYRSSRLEAAVFSAQDATRLSSLLGKNATILDVRTKRDADAHPDRQIVNASYRNVPIEGILDQTPMVTDPVRRIQLKRALLTAADAKGDVLVHCYAGKDRTGWIVAMIMYNSGANDQQVMAEYMRSQKAWPDGVKQEWMANGVKTAKKNYGSIRGYLTKGVGMSPAELAKLDRKFGAN